MKTILRMYAVGMITAAIATQNMPHIVEDHLSVERWNNLNNNMIANAVLWPIPAFASVSYQWRKYDGNF